jgi:hypothetical protein
MIPRAGVLRTAQGDRHGRRSAPSHRGAGRAIGAIEPRTATAPLGRKPGRRFLLPDMSRPCTYGRHGRDGLPAIGRAGAGLHCRISLAAPAPEEIAAAPETIGGGCSGYEETAAPTLGGAAVVRSPRSALSVRANLLLKTLREPLKPVSQGQELIAAARIEPERLGYPPERLRDTAKVRRPAFRRAVVHRSSSPC